MEIDKTDRHSVLLKQGQCESASSDWIEGRKKEYCIAIFQLAVMILHGLCVEIRVQYKHTL